tara:strand:- start:61 stop:1245 length:1185 start_codon:yes stop_codon:yes gene_type:complete
MYQGNASGMSGYEKLRSLHDNVALKSSRKVDIIQDPKLVSVHENGKSISIPNGQDEFGNYFQNRVTFSDNSITQIGQWCGMGTRYPKFIMGNEASPLLADNFNYWFQNKKTSPRMFRLYKPDAETGVMGKLRSFNSDLFRRLDDEILCRVIEPLMDKYPDLEIASANVNEDFFNVKFLFPEMEGEIQEGDTVRAGFRLKNSEIGKSFLRIDFLIMRLVCSNGMVASSVEHAIKRRHGGYRQPIGVQPKFLEGEWHNQPEWEWVHSFEAEVKKMVTHCTSPGRWQNYLEKMRESTGGQPIKFLSPISERNPSIASVELLTKTFGLSADEKRRINFAFLRSGDYTKWGFVNAITRAANDSTNYDSATNLEELGGKVLSFNNRQWLPFVEAEYKEAA